MNTWNAIWATLAIFLSAGAIGLAWIAAKVWADFKVDALEHNGAERDGQPIGDGCDAKPIDPLSAAYIQGFKAGVRTERSRIWAGSAGPLSGTEAVPNRE